MREEMLAIRAQVYAETGLGGARADVAAAGSALAPKRAAAVRRPRTPASGGSGGGGGSSGKPPRRSGRVAGSSPRYAAGIIDDNGRFMHPDIEASDDDGGDDDDDEDDEDYGGGRGGGRRRRWSAAASTPGDGLGVNTRSRSPRGSYPMGDDRPDVSCHWDRHRVTEPTRRGRQTLALVCAVCRTGFCHACAQNRFTAKNDEDAMLAAWAADKYWVCFVCSGECNWCVSARHSPLTRRRC